LVDGGKKESRLEGQNSVEKMEMSSDSVETLEP